MTFPLGLRLAALKSLSLSEAAAVAREHGIEALDLPPGGDSAAAETCHEQGLRVGSVDGVAMGQLLAPADAERESALDAVCAQVNALPALGTRVLFLCLNPADRTQPIARSLAIFKEGAPRLIAACEAAGVGIALEGWPGPAPTYPTLGYTPEVWRALFQALPSPAFGLCYDPSHLVRLGIDYLRVLEEFGERIHYCHGKDTALQPEAQYRYGHLPPALDEAPAYSGGAWRYCVPGSGVVQWDAVVYGLERAGYRGAISIELEDARYRGSAEKERAGIAKAAAHLRQAMS